VLLNAVRDAALVRTRSVLNSRPLPHQSKGLGTVVLFEDCGQPRITGPRLDCDYFVGTHQSVQTRNYRLVSPEFDGRDRLRAVAAHRRGQAVLNLENRGPESRSKARSPRGPSTVIPVGLVRLRPSIVAARHKAESTKVGVVCWGVGQSTRGSTQKALSRMQKPLGYIDPASSRRTLGPGGGV